MIIIIILLMIIIIIILMIILLIIIINNYLLEVPRGGHRVHDPQELPGGGSRPPGGQGGAQLPPEGVVVPVLLRGRLDAVVRVRVEGNVVPQQPLGGHGPPVRLGLGEVIISY